MQNTAKQNDKKSSFFKRHETAIIYIVIYGGMGLLFLCSLNWTHIVAFFSPTPKHKCETTIPSSSEVLYCNEDGTVGNKNEDKCLAKGADYEYENATCKKKESTTQKQDTSKKSTKVTYTCVDVTSYDNNYDNDMLCTSSTGKQFYTNYQHADLLVNGDPSEKYEDMENYDRYDYLDF